MFPFLRRYSLAPTSILDYIEHGSDELAMNLEQILVANLAH
jgi:hypothetical protein